MINPEINIEEAREVGQSALNAMSGSFGLSNSAQQKIGAFFVYCGMFEDNIEPVIWQMADEDPVGKKSSGDLRLGDRLKRLRTLGKIQDDDMAMRVTSICNVAADLLVYRNAIAHGWLCPSSDGSAPMFINHFSRRGENRKPMQFAFVNDTFLDMAVDASLSLFMCTVSLLKSYAQAETLVGSEQFTKERIDRAASYAKELRRFADLNFRRYDVIGPLDLEHP